MLKKILFFITLFSTGALIHSSLWATTAPKSGVRFSPAVREFLKNSDLHYRSGGLVKAIKRFREQKEISISEKVSLAFRFPVLVGKYANTGADEWPIAELQWELFDGPWPTGTMREYYREVSYGQFDLTGTVYGWYQVAHVDTFYEGKQTEPYDNGFLDPPRGIGGFMKELLDLSDPAVDFSQYDNDGPDGIPNSGDDDGVVDLVFLVHAGGGGEYGGPDIWSHRSRYSAYWGMPYITKDRKAGGGFIRVDDYIVQPALSDNGISMIEIGVFCHEFGHALGLPDLYDRTPEDDPDSEGIGHWGLMGSGNWNRPSSPAHLCAWSKEQLGWLTPIVPSANQRAVEIPEVELNPVLYKLWNGGNIEPYRSQYGSQQNTGREYFLLENRQAVGFDRYLHNSGLLIWHIDNSVRTQNDEKEHPLVDLEEADGWMEGRGDAGDPFPGKQNNRRFDYWTFPNSRAYDGSNSEVAALNIGNSGQVMTLDLEVREEHPAFFYEYHTIRDSQGNGNDEPEPGESVELVVTVVNYGASMPEVTATLSTGDPSVILTKARASFGPIAFSATKNNSVDPFLFSVADTASLHWASFRVDLLADGGRDSSRISFRQLIGHPPILLVDDDAQAEPNAYVFDVDTYYTAALDSIGQFYRYWDYRHLGRPSPSRLRNYDAVIWFTGYASPTLTQEDRQSLMAFLDGGGNLFISGQDLGNLAQLPEGRDFYHDYLHADFVKSYDSRYKYIVGVSGDPITDGLRFIFDSDRGARNQVSPDVISPRDGATSIFIYPATREVAGIKYAGAHKVVYLAFGFEALADFRLRGPEARADLMGRILRWFGLATGVELVNAESSLPSALDLAQNYPNPFNAETVISYQLPRAGEVEIKILDVLGREVRKLSPGHQQAGNHSVRWDGRDNAGVEVPSGVYVYQVKAGQFAGQKKLIVVR